MKRRFFRGRSSLCGCADLLIAEFDLFSEQRKMWVMRTHAQHHQISVETVQAMANIGIVSLRRKNVNMKFNYL